MKTEYAAQYLGAQDSPDHAPDQLIIEMPGDAGACPVFVYDCREGRSIEIYVPLADLRNLLKTALAALPPESDDG